MRKFFVLFSTWRLFIGFKHKIFPNFGCFSFIFRLKIVLLFCNYHAKIFKSFYNISFCFVSSFKSKTVKILQNFAWFIRIKAQNRAEKTSNSLHFFYENPGQFFAFWFKKIPSHASFFAIKKADTRRFCAEYQLVFSTNFADILQKNGIITEWFRDSFKW